MNVTTTGNIANFCVTENSRIKEILLATADAVLVEAAPYEHTWGTGMNAQDGRATRSEEWEGENLPGLTLMDVLQRI